MVKRLEKFESLNLKEEGLSLVKKIEELSNGEGVIKVFGERNFCECDSIPGCDHCYGECFTPPQIKKESYDKSKNYVQAK
ncbi:hypothetical protein HY837_03080 [archaeon]|nr:hypothetical protein [archaeon]